MRNLALVINDNTITDHSIVQSTTVNGGTSADLDAIADNHATKLGDLHPVTTIVRVTKSIRSNDSAGLDQAIFTDLDVVVNRHIRPQA